MQVQIDNDTFQYGHEYVGLNPIFQVLSLLSVYSSLHLSMQPYVIGGNPVLAFKMALK